MFDLADARVLDINSIIFVDLTIFKLVYDHGREGQGAARRLLLLVERVAESLRVDGIDYFVLDDLLVGKILLRESVHSVPLSEAAREFERDLNEDKILHHTELAKGEQQLDEEDEHDEAGDGA